MSQCGFFICIFKIFFVSLQPISRTNTCGKCFSIVSRDYLATSICACKSAGCKNKIDIHKRRDGKFPISIRVTNNRKSCYIPSGLYCTFSQINKKTFEIKDQFLIAKLAHIMYEYERKLLTIDTANICTLDSKSFKKNSYYVVWRDRFHS